MCLCRSSWLVLLALAFPRRRRGRRGRLFSPLPRLHPRYHRYRHHSLQQQAQEMVEELQSNPVTSPTLSSTSQTAET